MLFFRYKQKNSLGLRRGSPLYCLMSANKMWERIKHISNNQSKYNIGISLHYSFYLARMIGLYTILKLFFAYNFFYIYATVTSINPFVSIGYFAFGSFEKFNVLELLVFFCHLQFFSKVVSGS